jgi:chemotaxis protein methyltransferase CheR
MDYSDLSDRDFSRLSALVYEKCGINLHDGKKALVRARLGKRLRQKGFQSFKQYYQFLVNEDSGDELIHMLDAISTNLTSFFREEKHFDFLVKEIFPTYQKARKGRRLTSLRFWSAGCSSGEEAYTLGICLLEYLENPASYDIRILASDISTKVLTKAMQGIYPESRVENVSHTMLRKYFQQGQGNRNGFFKVKPKLKNMVEFRRLNLMEPFPFNGTIHVIFCRNVMIYFDKKTQENLINKFYSRLVSGGFLLIGHSESLTGISHRFKYIKPTVYQR